MGQPTLWTDEGESARSPHLLRSFLLLSGIATAAFLVLGWPEVRNAGRALSATALLWFGVLGFLNRAGFYRLAAAGYLGGIWLFITLALVLFGAFRSPVATGYAVVALASALLFGARGAVVSAGAIVASCIGIALADAQGWFPPGAPPTPNTALFAFLGCFLSLIGLAFVAAGEMRHAFASLRQQVEERGIAEARLRDSEARFRSIVDSSPMAILLYRLDEGGRLVLTGSNPTGDRVLGVPVSALVGKTIEEAFPALADTEVPGHYRRLCSEGGSWESEVTYADPRFAGTYEVHAFQTAPRMMAVMFLDVSERRRAEEEKSRLEGQLRHSQKMEAVGRLAGGIAHDFNNLLMVIMGHGELLGRELGGDDSRLRSLRHMMSASERAARLVRQLLAFGRKQVLEPQLVDVNALVSETARMLRPLLGEDVQVLTQLDPALGCARVDPAQIDQVLMNLAVNAREAMPDGGSLSLETAVVEAPVDLPPCADGYVCLTVRDTGHGMDDKTRAQAFEPFFTTKGESGGSGLGLAMVYGIVRQSGGQVSVDSAPGRGSSFQVFLPRTAGPAPSGPSRAPGEPAPPGGETVLVVEDDPAIRSLACEMLELEGYRTLSAASGEDALRLTEGHVAPIHLLLTDVVMSGMGGPALAERFLRLRPQAGVLFMSGYAGEDLARRGVSDFPSRLLPKPFTAAELAAHVREALDA